MKKLLTLVFSSIPFLSFAQVGIGTTTPLEALHVAGSTSTIRIESLNDANSIYNDGVKPASVFVDDKGNLTLTPPSVASGSGEPLNFLINVPNFIPDNPASLPFNAGVVITSPVGVQSVEGFIYNVTFTVPQTAVVEVKHGVSFVLSSVPMNAPPYLAYINDSKSRVINTFFCFDVNNDGLSVAEKALQYGHKGQFYCSVAGGSLGYPYMNSQGYATLPPGTHSIHFFGVINDPPNTVTSIGFGGATDYLKLRVYN